MSIGQPLTRDSTISRATGLLEAEMDGEVVMLNLERGSYYGLDDIGTAIWSRLAEPAAISELSLVLAKEYDADATSIERDILPLLEEMRRESLIEVQA